MKSLFRLGVLLLLVGVFALAPAFSVSAQDGCLPGLSADDCALAAAADANVANIKSFQIESFSFNLSVAGAPEGDMAIAVTGAGTVDATAMNPNVSDPASALAGLLMQLTMNASLTGPEAQQGALEFRIVDGDLYILSSDAGEQWLMLNLPQLIQAGMQGGNLPIDPSRIAGAAGSVDPAQLAALGSAFEQVPNLVTGSAADDPSVDNVATRALTANIDLKPLGEFLATPQAAQALQALGDEAASLAMLGPMFQPIFDTTTIQATRYIGVSDQMPHGLSINFATTLDPQTMAMLTGEAPAAGTNPISISMQFDIRLAQINQAQPVEAPANAMDMTQMITGGMNMMMATPTPSK
ncbi:MAG: hypothetical protein IT323_11055 [Anaerolineae bacterium]|nr:hypothetical protein [Anaerolineae bacterium]